MYTVIAGFLLGFFGILIVAAIIEKDFMEDLSDFMGMGFVLGLVLGIVGSLIAIPIGAYSDEYYVETEVVTLEDFTTNSMKKVDSEFYQVNYFVEKGDTIYVVPFDGGRRELDQFDITFVVDTSYHAHMSYDIYRAENPWGWRFESEMNFKVITEKPITFKRTRSSEKLENE